MGRLGHGVVTLGHDTGVTSCMHIEADLYWATKAGNSRDDYEDAAHVPTGGDCEIYSCAVADGATEASYSKIWAEMLVHGYSDGTLTHNITDESLTQLQTEWREKVTLKPQPWYAEQKTLLGAFSSFLGLTITKNIGNSNKCSWQAVAVGDSCLFLVSNNELLESFPVEKSSSFGDDPFLISSLKRANSNLQDAVTQRHGKCVAGDHLFLMTDAIAAWFLRASEDGKQPWHAVLEVIRARNEDDRRAYFQQWVDKKRYKGEMRNDDVTMVHIEVTDT